MIDVTYFGNNYFNWQEKDEDALIDILEEMKFNYIFVVSQNEVPGVFTEIKSYGYPGKIAPFMEDQWTYFYQYSKIHFYFKSEKDKMMAILLR